MRSRDVPAALNNTAELLADYRERLVKHEDVLRRFAAMQPDGGTRVQRQVDECRSVIALVSAGATTPRRFDVPVRLTVRCPRRGHVLALVYATTPFPVLVPEVTPHDVVDPERAADPWLLEKPSFESLRRSEDDADGMVNPFDTVSSVVALSGRHRGQQTLADKDGVAHALAFHLHCRCGSASLLHDTLMDTLNRKSDVLTAHALR